jgi:hypothetical protein
MEVVEVSPSKMHCPLSRDRKRGDSVCCFVGKVGGGKGTGDGTESMDMPSTWMVIDSEKKPRNPEGEKKMERRQLKEYAL